MRTSFAFVALFGVIALYGLHRYNIPTDMQPTVTMPESEMQQIVNEIRDLQQKAKDEHDELESWKAQFEYARDCVKKNAANNLPTLTCFNYDEISGRTVYGKEDVTAD